jgi:hypothetical protein
MACYSGMQTIIRTPARMRLQRAFVVNSHRRNWVYALFEERTDRPIGVRLEWFPDEYVSAPLNYITTDDGKTFRHVTEYLIPFGTGGIDDRIEEQKETRPETLAALRGLLTTWRANLGAEF